MKKLIYILVIVIIPLTCLGKKKKNPLKTEMDSLSYALGIEYAEFIKQNEMADINIEVFSLALEDVFSDDTVKTWDVDAKEYINKYFIKLSEMKGQENLQKGKDFLAANKTKEGIVELESGLQYKIITNGEGPKPSVYDNVVCHYEGSLIDGTVFDSSYKRGEPAEFPLSGVIAGWTEALQLMPAGSKWVLYIPADLGYGERGA